MNRIANGVPMTGTKVVAADAIAKFAGVNLNTVVKVIMAVNALRYAGFSLDEIINHDSLPLENADAERFDATESFVQGELAPAILLMTTNAGTREVSRELQIKKRFG